MKTRSKTKNRVKLPKKLKDRWVKALRSGKYGQTNGTLYYSDDVEEGFCCLGVACKLQEVDTDDMYIAMYPEQLGDKVKEKLHPFFLQTNDDGDIDDTILYKLATFNDSGKSFKWIAAYIDRYL